MAVFPQPSVAVHFRVMVFVYGQPTLAVVVVIKVIVGGLPELSVAVGVGAGGMAAPQFRVTFWGNGGVKTGGMLSPEGTTVLA